MLDSRSDTENPTIVEHVSSYFLTDIDFTKLLSNDCKTVGMDGFIPIFR